MVAVRGETYGYSLLAVGVPIDMQAVTQSLCAMMVAVLRPVVRSHCRRVPS